MDEAAAFALQAHALFVGYEPLDQVASAELTITRRDTTFGHGLTSP
jgi:hypothetical protein